MVEPVGLAEVVDGKTGGPVPGGILGVRVRPAPGRLPTAGPSHAVENDEVAPTPPPVWGPGRPSRVGVGT